MSANTAIAAEATLPRGPAVAFIMLLGVLYDRSIAGVVIASTGLQAAALPVLYRLWRRYHRSSA